MRYFRLLRVSKIESGIFGVLMDSEVPFCVTVENDKYVFPNGTYTCRRVNSPRFGNTFEITGIIGRTHILFHKGNWEDDSRGCVILGESFEILMGKNGVASSGHAFKEFLKRLEGVNEFTLIVNSWNV